MLLVDDRVGSREFLRPLRVMGLPCREARLKSADFSFRGHGPSGPIRVGVERKTVTEMLGAVQDSRFVGHQLPLLVGGRGTNTNRETGAVTLRRYDYVFLVVEGYWSIDREGCLVQGQHAAGYDRHYHMFEPFAKFQLTLALKGGIRIYPSRSFTETTHFLHALYRWFDKPWSSHKSAYQVDETHPDRAILTERTVCRRVAAQLPGVGWERSRQVARYFSNDIAKMTAATVEEWKAALQIEKGTTIARRLVEVCHGRQDH